MLNFFREGLHYIHLAFFKPLTLEGETRNLPKKEATIIFLKTYIVACIFAVLLLAMAGVVVDVVDYLLDSECFLDAECPIFHISYPFDWYIAYKRLFLVLVAGLVTGLVSGLIDRLTATLIGVLVFVLVLGVGFGLLGGLVFGLFDELVGGVTGGLFEGIAVGLLTGFSFGLIFGLAAIRLSIRDLFLLLVVVLVIGLVVGWHDGQAEVIDYLIVFSLAFLVVYFRPFYLLPQLWQYWHSKSARNPFQVFHNSPVYWDEAIRVPLPYLEDWLVFLLKCDQQRGINELFFVIKKSPSQHKVAFKVLLADLGKFLQRIQSIDGLVGARNTSVVPAYYNGSPEGLQDAHRHGQTIAALAQDYKTRQTKTGQLKILDELRKEISTFHAVMKLTGAPVGTTFEPLAAKWLKMIEDEQEKLHQQSTHNELPNPYIAGNPLEVRDQQLFVGRSDILLAIEQFILNAEQRPSLLLYGRRRTGKSSTLLNLPRSRFEPVYIDCQDAKWHESDQAFCYNLAHDLFNVLYQSDSVRGLRQPQIEQFDKNAFTQLDQFLTQAQKIADQRGKRILLAFDEYEELENSIINGDISEKVLGKLRNLIQHSKSIVVLVSGSHRFEELTRLNWANYLINTRTLELSYLDAESARELLTKPVPELHYEAGVVDDIIRITHCQPYLLQAVASELVNYLNSKQQTTATPDDLNTALEKTLVSASAYFSDTWRKDNSEAEQQVMRALATGKTESVLADAAFQPAIQSLIRKEVVEGVDGSYRLAVELFARWIVKNQV